MVDARNIGCLIMDVPAGTNLTELIYDAIRERNIGWKANKLHTLELIAQDNFSFTMNGWVFESVQGTLYMNSLIFGDIVMLTDVKHLKMYFRYDD